MKLDDRGTENQKQCQERMEECIGFCYCFAMCLFFSSFYLIKLGYFFYQIKAKETSLARQVHPIENELRDGSQMKSIVRTSIVLCTTVYVATSFFGFLLFGDHTLDDVLANFDGELGIPYSSLLNDVILFIHSSSHLFHFLGANCVPSIWDAFQFTGATATISVGFIFPAAIVLWDTHGIATKRDRLVSWVMILFAVSSSTVAICSDIYSIFNIGVQA